MGRNRRGFTKELKHTPQQAAGYLPSKAGTFCISLANPEANQGVSERCAGSD
jgi:hypothetical protein